MYHFIVNPHSGTGIASKIWNTIKGELDRNDISYKLYLTEPYRGALTFANEISSNNKATTIVVLGGDGTLNEVVSGIKDFSTVTLGYIPCGSSNDFARSMKLETNPIKALYNILNPRETVSVNIGRITCKDGTSRCFAVSTGIGFDAAICHAALHSKIKNFLNIFHLGKITYSAIAVKEVFVPMRRNCTVYLDDYEASHFDKFFFATCMNQPYEGGGYMFCPAADPADDLLNICVYGGMGRIKFISSLLKASKGKHTGIKGIYFNSARKIRIVTGQKYAVHADGESCDFQNDITMEVMNQKMNLILR